MGMKEVKEVNSKTESGERGVVCGTDEKATIMEVTATLVMPSLSPAPCLCTSGRWRPTSPTRCSRPSVRPVVTMRIKMSGNIGLDAYVVK